MTGPVQRPWIIPPAQAAKVRTCETPCWDAALRKHHHRLVKAGVTTWADEGRTLVQPKPRKKPTSKGARA